MATGDDYFREHFFGDLQASLLLFESLAPREGGVRAMPGEFSRAAARSFAQGLILDGEVSEAKRRMQSDREGLVSFYEVAHDVSDLLSSRRSGWPGREWKCVQSTDGRHEPFLLIASAVLNRLDWMDQHDPEDEM